MTDEDLAVWNLNSNHKAGELVAAVAVRLRHIAGTKWGTKKYLDIGLLKKLSEGTVFTG